MEFLESIRNIYVAYLNKPTANNTQINNSSDQGSIMNEFNKWLELYNKENEGFDDFISTEDRINDFVGFVDYTQSMTNTENIHETWEVAEIKSDENYEMEKDEDGSDINVSQEYKDEINNQMKLVGLVRNFKFGELSNTKNNATRYSNYTDNSLKRVKQIYEDINNTYIDKSEDIDLYLTNAQGAADNIKSRAGDILNIYNEAKQVLEEIEQLGNEKNISEDTLSSIQSTVQNIKDSHDNAESNVIEAKELEKEITARTDKLQSAINKRIQKAAKARTVIGQYNDPNQIM